MPHSRIGLLYKKRRGIVKASLTKLRTKLMDLERDTTIPTLMESTRNLADMLETLRQESKTHQLAIMGQTNEEYALADEQQVLDDNYDQVSELCTHLTSENLTYQIQESGCSQSSQQAVDSTAGQTRVHRYSNSWLGQYWGEHCMYPWWVQRSGDWGQGWADCAWVIFAEFWCPYWWPHHANQAQVNNAAFDCQLRIKKRLHVLITTSNKAIETTATKLPKLELLTFYGDILQWKNFWEQFYVSVHDWATIPKKEKLMYLQKAIKDKTVNSLIAGLTKSSELYDETIKCLQERYNCPRQIHWTHVCHIVEAPRLKDGTGKEMHALHNLVVQHLRALKSLNHKPSQAFITSLLEMKLDSIMMFKWQRHSQDHTDVPEYQVLLDFLNLRAQATEASA